MNRIRRFLAATVVAVLAGSIVAPAAFGATTTLGGYVTRSTAGPITVIFQAPSAGVPANPTGEFNIARTIARAEVGTGYALGSIAWPGEVVANVPSVLGDQVNDNFEQNGAPRIFPHLPNYPVRAEAFYPQGPTDQDAGVETVQMHAVARDGRSEAFSGGGDTAFPGLVGSRRVASVSRSYVDGGEAISESSATLQDVSILGGIITAKLVSNTVRAVSDGVSATVEGDLTIAGLEVGGEIQGNEIPGGSIILDANGLSTNGDHQGPTNDDINEAGKALEAMGISLIVPGPINTVNGASGARSDAGLIVFIDIAKFEPYRAMLPPQVRDELDKRGVFFDQSIVISIGSVAAQTNAAPMYVPPPPPVNPPVVPGALPVAPVIIPGPSVPGPTVTLPPQAGIPTISGRPVAASFPVPLAFVILAILLAFFGTYGLGTFADRATMPATQQAVHH